MSENKWWYRKADGQWCLGVGPDVAKAISDPVNYALIDLGITAPVPDPRTTKCDGTRCVARTTGEIAAFDAETQGSAPDVTTLAKVAAAVLDLRARVIALEANNPH